MSIEEQAGIDYALSMLGSIIQCWTGLYYLISVNTATSYVVTTLIQITYAGASAYTDIESTDSDV